MTKVIDNNKKKFFADIGNYAGWLRTSVIARHCAITELYKNV